MSKKTFYTIAFYTLKPLPLEMRATFSLTGSPYKRPEALNHLKDYEVIHFRDEIHPIGLVLSPNGTDYTKVSPIDVYHYCAKLETDNKTYARISTWNSGSVHRKWGDSYSWLRWGEQKKIVKLAPDIIHLVK